LKGNPAAGVDKQVRNWNCGIQMYLFPDIPEPRQDGRELMQPRPLQDQAGLSGRLLSLPLA